MLKDLSNLLSAGRQVHHAYLVVGDPEEAENIIKKTFCLTGSPDYFAYKEPLFGIEEAREVSGAAIRRAFSGKKIFFIAPERITTEAQNALLKTFEDPISDTHFFLVLRDVGLVIPTLKSRVETIHVKSSAFDNGAEEFLKMPVTKRLEFAKKFADEERNLPVFLDQLLLLKRDEAVYKMRLRSADRGASARLILEHLALVLP